MNRSKLVPPRVPKSIMEVYLERGHLRGMAPVVGKHQSFRDAVASSSYPLAAIMAVASGTKQPRCKVCNTFTSWKGGSFWEYCSAACAYSDQEYWSKRQEAYREEHGVSHHMHTSEVKKKVQDSMIRKHGVPWAMMSESIRNKSKSTCLREYGGEHYASSPAGLASMHERGSFQKAQSTRKETMRRRYGVSSPLQIPEVLEKQQTSARRRKMVTIGGRTFSLQGSEDVVIRHLVTEKKVPVSRIDVTASEGVPTIGWTDRFNNKQRAYFPDLAVRMKDRYVVVEVKSEFTLCSALERNFCKFRAALTEGHELWLAVVTRKGRLTQSIDWIRDPGRMTYAEFRKQVNSLVSSRFPS